MLERNKLLFFGLFICALEITHYTAFAQQPSQQYNLSEKRDPFIPLVTNDGRLLKLESRGSEELGLQGVIYDSNGSSFAVVNKAVVRVGDWVGPYQVYKIENNKVIFLKEGQEKTVELKKEEQ